jgi:nucleotide-binding universal stress UspA family protein
MFKKILVPLDSSTLAERALPYAQKIAHCFESELILLHVLSPAAILAEYGEHCSHPDYHLREREVKTRTYLALIQDGLTAQYQRARIEFLTGNPVAEMILETAADKTVDLIVMSTHGYSGRDRRVYGSVAGKVLEETPCPVFLVRVNGASRIVDSPFSI